MYDGGRDRYAIKNIISCGDVTWEEYCSDKETYEKLFYNIMLTIDLYKNCDVEFYCSGRLYRGKRNILCIRKDNDFSKVCSGSRFDKWYMVAMLCDVVRKKGEEHSKIMDKISALAEERPVVEISDETCSMLEEKCSQLCRLSAGDKRERDLLSVELLNSIVRCIESSSPVSGEAMQINLEKIDKVIEYIKKNVDSQLTMDKISYACYFDKYHLSKMFKKYTDHTINQFVTVYRIMRSIEYLSDGYSVEEAGKMSGFKNVYTYIKTFKMVNHITPKQFIKREI